MSALITIIGATGLQGGSVVDTALAAGYKVRAVTRNNGSEKAKALAARGVEVVAADQNDLSSLIKAFEGSTYIFAVTDFFEPFATGGPEAAMKVEEAQGINMAKAAAATHTLKHYIWSTLPNSKKVSGGKYIVPHFEAKNQIDAYIKSDAKLLAKTTFLWVLFYGTNMIFPMFTPNLMKSSGKYVQLSPASPSTPILTTGDTRKNVGPFVEAIISHPELTLGGRYVIAEVDRTTAGDYLKLWGEVTGRSTAYVQTSLEDYDSVWPAWAKEMGIMMQMWDEYGLESWGGEDLITPEMLGLDKSKLASTREALEGIDWSEF